MNKQFFIIALMLIPALTVGQVTKKDLKGDWRAANDDSLYYKSDTISLFRDINHFTNSHACNLIEWSINKQYFKLNSLFVCTEPGRVRTIEADEKLSFNKTDFGQVILLKRDRRLIDKFKILELNETKVDRYPHYINELKLMRFDDLTEEKLYKYINYLIFNVLKYDSTAVSTNPIENLKGNLRQSEKIEIHNKSNKNNPEPLIIANGHIIHNKNLLREIRLVETIKIDFLTKEKASSIWGTQAINGVIVITISKKKFNKSWEKYGS